jgi:hypothetical protein
MTSAYQIIKDVKSNVTQCSSSKKDEITVMQAMMNDTNFSVDVYSKGGKVDEYYPSRELRKMVTNVVASTTHIPVKEATELVNSYEFTRVDAAAMVNASKEFVNTYLQTGRKLPLGGRKNSDVELMWKNIEDRTTEIPIKSETGERLNTFIPAHGGIKAINPCPEWLK